MSKESKNIALIVSLLFVVTSIFSQKKVSDAKFDRMLDKLLSHSVTEVIPSEIKNENDIVFLDSREKKEYKISHIKNAVWVGYDDFKLNRVKNTPKNKKIVVYCSVGYRSEKIAEKLLNSGYTNVSNLYGGIFEWVHKDKKIYNKKGAANDVHTFNKEWSQWLLKGKTIY